MWSSLLLAGEAYAGACCGTTTSAVPTRPAECDRVVAGVGLGAEASLGRWDSSRAQAPSSVDEGVLTATIGAGARWASWGYATAAMPLQLTRREVAGDAAWGGGAGDASVAVFAEPFEEDAGAPIPVPTLGVGLRIPTGRSWEESDDPLLADVTGTPEAALTAQVGVERTLGAVPWSLGAGLVMPFGATPPALDVSGAVGRAFGEDWTVSATARYTLDPADVVGGAAATSLGVRVVRGERLAWRAWLGAEASVPLDGLGRSAPQAAALSGGLVLVR